MDNALLHLDPKSYQAYLNKKKSGEFVSASQAYDRGDFWGNNFRSSIGEYDTDHSATKDE